MVALTVTAMLALAFAPISLFFLITAPDYGFFKLLNVAILALSALVGLRFLTGGMRVLNEHGLLAPPRPAEVAPVSPAVPAVPPAAGPAPAPAGSPHAVTAPAAAPANGVIAAPAPANGVTAAAAESAALHGVAAGGPATAVATRPDPALEALRQQHAARRPQPVPSPTPPSMTLLYVWILLFGFVGTQLAWTLRPFFGDPGHPFALFRHIDGTFYADILQTISRLLHG
jgi:hypothetical protein